jgi:hypothetical protein
MTENELFKLIEVFNTHWSTTGEYRQAREKLLNFVKPLFVKPKLYQARVEIPEPVRDAGEMKYGQQYFMPMLTSREKFSYSYWHGDSDDLFRLEQGLIYLKEEDVIKRTDAGLQVEYAE